MNQPDLQTELSLHKINSQVNQLIRLKSNAAKEKILTTCSYLAEQYLAELFRGNGWTVSIYGDKRKALLLSDPKNPEVILMMVRLLNNDTELTYTEAREELIMFENVIGPLYGCSQFCIIAGNGYEAKAEQLENFNLLLQDWSYIDDLLDHYSKDKIQEPRIQLFAHNKQTYKKVQKMMQQNKSVAVVQATGTGKSYLISKLLQDFTGEKRLVMAPSLYVINQVKEHIHWDKEHIEFMTYARSINLTQSEVAQLQPKLIVLDEFHRCGAEEWGRGVDNILNAYPQAVKFGTSATPVRYLDNERDMSKELFEGNVAENLSLAQAIVRNILPMPKYVCALYTLAEETEALKTRIGYSKQNENRKNQLLLELDTFNLDWEKSHGIASVLKKHFTKNMRKFIVFCRDEEHLLEIEPIVKKWFSEATDNFPLKSSRVYTNESKSDEHLEQFKYDASKEYIQLLFSINMLNEGVHVNDVHGVILLRPTESPNIFYQQIGRCLKSGMNHQPVIFDFVNNFKSIRTQDFLYDLEAARKQYLEERNDTTLEDRCPKFTVHDEVRKITEIFGEIEFKLDTWDDTFKMLLDYKELKGNCNVPHADEEHRILYLWVNYQREKCYYGKLAKDRFEKLNELGVQWNLDQFGYSRTGQWEKLFERLQEFRKKFGHCNVTETQKEYKELYYFVSRHRDRYRKGLLEKYHIDKLNAIGFEWDRRVFLEGLWQKQFEQLIKFKNKHGHFKMPQKKLVKLSRWVTIQRKRFKQGTLESSRIQKLNNIGFDWQPQEDANVLFAKCFEEIKNFYAEHRHCRLPSKGALAKFGDYMKRRYEAGTLSGDETRQLDHIGFIYVRDTTDFREKRIQEFEKFIKEYGHADIDSTYQKHASLYNWLKSQRAAYKKGKLRADYIERMEKMGVDLSTGKNEKLWNEKYEQLKKHYKIHGNSRVKKNSRQNKLLEKWMVRQRQKFNEGILSEAQIKKLNKLEFDWRGIEGVWEKYFEQLVEFRKANGHCLVPTDKSDLGKWCARQRARYQKGNLLPERIQQLESLNFTWNADEEQWQNNYKQLKETIENHGWNHLSRVNKKMNTWLNNLRSNYKTGIIPEEKIMLLNMIGIPWTPIEIQWDKMFNELLQYKNKTGLSVAPVYKETKQLGMWCCTQRKNYRKNMLSPEQIKKLEEINFPWHVKMGIKYNK